MVKVRVASLGPKVLASRRKPRVGPRVHFTAFAVELLDTGPATALCHEIRLPRLRLQPRRHLARTNDRLWKMARL